MTGLFMLSLDTEIAWGTYSDLNARAPAFDRYPELLRRLVNLLNIYEVSATWAVVGHLLLPQGEPSPAPHPHYSFTDAPDDARLQNHPARWFYGRYVIDTIQAARVPQEIGTHTFSHVLATDSGVSRGIFAAQLAAVRKIHTANGLPAPRSLVYPQNRVAYTDLLREYGIITYRGVAQDWYAALPSLVKRPAHLVDRSLALPPPTYAPADCIIDEGLVNLPASQFLMSYDGVRARIPTAARVKQAARGIAQAAQRGDIFHLWFHPFNLGSSEAMFDALTQILALVWAAREAGRLRILTMGDMADEILGQ